MPPSPCRMMMCPPATSPGKSARLSADSWARRIGNSFSYTAASLAAGDLLDDLPRRNVIRQHALRTALVNNAPDGIDDLPLCIGDNLAILRSAQLPSASPECGSVLGWRSQSKEPYSLSLNQSIGRDALSTTDGNGYLRRGHRRADGISLSAKMVCQL